MSREGTERGYRKKSRYRTSSTSDTNFAEEMVNLRDVEFGAVQKCVNLLDVEESCKMSH